MHCQMKWEGDHECCVGKDLKRYCRGLFKGICSHNVLFT